MKPTMRLLALLLLLLTVLALACAPDVADGVGKKYHCPMHPTIVRDQPGECPICHMTLVEFTPTPAASTIYACPMHPEVTSDHPGQCPKCGMALEPRTAVSGHAVITVDAEHRQKIGLTTAEVKRERIAASIRTVGRVAFDETRVHHVHTKFEAYVDHVHADFTGKAVRKGEPLVAVYSPELLAAQEEYVLALRSKRGLEGSPVAGVAEGGRSLLESARERLELWDMSAKDLDEIERTGRPMRSVPIYSPIDGVVVAKTAVHGMKTDPGMELFAIADLSRVWVIADLYEAELPRVAVGQQATTTLSYWPGREWKGRVTYIYPTVDAETRTVKVRLELSNADGSLKPDMFADVVLAGDPQPALVVPDDAVLDSGVRQIAFVLGADDRVEPRQVKVGVRSNGRVEIMSGLAEGEKVVTRAAFLVDSESRLRAALEGMGDGVGEGDSHVH